MPFYDVAPTVGPDPLYPALVELEQVTPRLFRLTRGFRYVREGQPITSAILVPPHQPVGPDGQPLPDQSTDLASVPTVLWGLVASYGQQTLPALLHDYLCNEAAKLPRAAAFEKRRVANELFHESLRERGVTPIRARLMWAAVSLDGHKDYAPRRFWAEVLHLLAMTAVLWYAVYAGIAASAGHTPRFVADHFGTSGVAVATALVFLALLPLTGLLWGASNWKIIAYGAWLGGLLFLPVIITTGVARSILDWKLVAKSVKTWPGRVLSFAKRIFSNTAPSAADKLTTETLRA